MFLGSALNVRALFEQGRAFNGAPHTATASVRYLMIASVMLLHSLLRLHGYSICHV